MKKKSLFQNASQSFLLLNDLNFPNSNPVPTSPVRSKLERNDEHGALGAGQGKAADTGRFFVVVTSVRKRLLDEDNLCEKFVVDCCRYAGILPADSPDKTSIKVQQRKAEKGEAEHTVVEIFYEE